MTWSAPPLTEQKNWLFPHTFSERPGAILSFVAKMAMCPFPRVASSHPAAEDTAHHLPTGGDDVPYVDYAGLCHSTASNSPALPQCYARSFQQHPIITGDLFCEVRQNWNIHFAQTAALENTARFHLVTKSSIGSSFLNCWFYVLEGTVTTKHNHSICPKKVCAVLLCFCFVCFIQEQFVSLESKNFFCTEHFRIAYFGGKRLPMATAINFQKNFLCTLFKSFE